MCELCDAGREHLAELGLVEFYGGREDYELSPAGKVLGGLLGEYIFARIAQATQPDDDGFSVDI